MNPPLTLSGYIAKQFTLAVIAMLLALSGLVAMFDYIELLRRAASRPDVTFGLVSEIAALRLPYIAMQILPFAVLLGGILCFWRLTRSSELIVARAAGISAWEFLAAPTLCALLLGVLATSAISPVSSVMFARAETLDNTFLKTGGGPLALTGGQLWLRQSDRGFTPKEWRSFMRMLSNCMASTSSQPRSACSVWMGVTSYSPKSRPPTLHSAPDHGRCRMRVSFISLRCRRPPPR